MRKIKSVPVKKEVVREVVIENQDTVVEEEGGFGTLLGKNVCIMCLNYIYSGRLVGVNSTCVELEDTKLVYETGAWGGSDWKDAQLLPSKSVFVSIGAIEACFEVQRK